jgi:hypothetical protein
LSCIFINIVTYKSLIELSQKERKKISLLRVPCSSFSFYDLPPFFATLVFVFLLADASPFLLDFFLVAIDSMVYAHTIINDLLAVYGNEHHIKPVRMSTS